MPTCNCHPQALLEHGKKRPHLVPWLLYLRSMGTDMRGPKAQSSLKALQQLLLARLPLRNLLLAFSWVLGQLAWTALFGGVVG